MQEKWAWQKSVHRKNHTRDMRIFRYSISDRYSQDEIGKLFGLTGQRVGVIIKTMAEERKAV